MVQAWCKDNFKSFLFKETLAPFSWSESDGLKIWSILERKACAVLHSNVEKLKKLKESWAKIESETIPATCDQVIFHLCRVIIEKGGYIE